MKFFPINTIAAILFAALTFMSCETTRKDTNKFQDDTLLKIADWQDRRQSDSIYQYLQHPQPAYREMAALALASVQDSAAVLKLQQLQADTTVAVRTAAAFALGQTPSSKTGEVIAAWYLQETSPRVKRELLEAYGKTTRQISLDLFALQTDTLIAAGQAWGIYRLGLRGMANDSLTTRAMALLAQPWPTSVRLGAAHYLARGPKQIPARFNQHVIHVASNDPSVDVRIATVSSLRRFPNDSTAVVLANLLRSDADYRVRVSAVRALQAFPNHHLLLPSLHDAHLQVQVAAAEALKALADVTLSDTLLQQARRAQHWRVKGTLYAAVLVKDAPQAVVSEVIAAARAAQNPYARAALIGALEQTPGSFDFLVAELGDTSAAPVVRSTAATALVTLNTTMGAAASSRFAPVYEQFVQVGDAPIIGTLAGALADTALAYKKIFKDVTFLRHARARLSLPRDNEAVQPVEAALAYFDGRSEPTPVVNAFNHPIDWTLVKGLRRHQRARIKTAKGDMIIRLLVEEAPGSVANFVQLLQQHYFDRKNFHRVVPNFVAQGGCNRGDGWGSEDYSIRSEFSPRRYTTGSLGMASAGKDTEGTQWFITHSPTPHLDGRYTIFAEVEQGMEVAAQLEVGDEIISVTLEP